MAEGKFNNAAETGKLLLITVDDSENLLKYSGQLLSVTAAASGSTGIMMSTLWNQSGVARVGNNTTITYNQYCPYISGTQTHSLTGCTNTAAGQIIYYFIERGELDLQLTLNASDAYTDDNGLCVNADGSTPGTVSFAAINSKLAQYDLNSADDAAALVYACGVVQEATYGDPTSTAWWTELFYRAGFECVNESYFYSDANSCWGRRGNISEGGFEVLIENLTAGRVVGTSYPDHALVIDGYNAETDKFHINFGWGSSLYTRWYTRAEMNAQGYYNFIYDLMPQGETEFFVTDSRIYGTGTLARAMELAAGTTGANTVTFRNSVAGGKLHFSQTSSFFELKEATVINNFNMDLMLDDSNYGYFAFSNAAAQFDDFSGALIVNNDSYACCFYFSEGGFNFESSGGVIFAGEYRVSGNYASGSEAILASLRNSQKNNTGIAQLVSDSMDGYSFAVSDEADAIVLTNKTLVAGNISLGDGDDTLTVTGNSHVYGHINCGNGNDVITIDSTSSITGGWYGSGNLDLVLTETPDSRAMFYITNNVTNLVHNAVVTVDLSMAQAGDYTLIEAWQNPSSVNQLNTLSITVRTDTSASHTLNVNRNPDCTLAQLLRVGDSLVLRVKAAAVQDRRPPSIPGALTSTVSKNTVVLDWGDSTDDQELAGYYYRYGMTRNLSGEGTFTAQSGTTLYNLDSGTYYFQVRAKDAAGNFSDWSEAGTFTVVYSDKAVIITSGGLVVSSAAVMTDKRLSGAAMQVSNGGSAVRTTLLSGGVQTLLSGGTASATQVSSGGSLHISSYGTLSGGTIYNGGTAVVSPHGSASGVVVSSGGVLHLSSGGTLTDAENSGGILHLKQGAIVSGSLVNCGSMAVSSGVNASGAHIELSISGKNPNNNAMVSGIAYLRDASFSITVSSDQAQGRYTLSDNVTAFSKTFTIGTAADVFGSITVGGSTVIYGDASYKLLLDTSAGKLFLMVGAASLSAPQVSANVSRPTNGDVKLSALFDANAVYKEFRIDGGEWQNYSDGVTVSENCTVEFRCRDALDAASQITVFHVTNIDKSAPVITVSPSTTAPAAWVLLTASADDGSSIKYSTDNHNWRDYTSPVEVVQNGTVYFKSTDSAGNTSFTNCVISNIDPSIPLVPVIAADTELPTNGVVTLSLHFTSAAVVKEYSLDGQKWNECGNTLKITENCTVYVRETDWAGHISESAVYVVSNIDRSAPEKVDSFEYQSASQTISWNNAADTGTAGIAGYRVRYGQSSTLNGGGVFVETNAFDAHTLSAGEWYFQVCSVDAAGNMSGWSETYRISITLAAPSELSGDSTCLSWQAVPGATGYVVEYSADNFETVLSLTVTTPSLDHFALPESDFQWRVRAIGSDAWACGENTIAGARRTGSTKYIAGNNGSTDLFFANADGSWSSDFAAQHLGCGSWRGTGELAEIRGKNKFTDIFAASGDASILLLSDSDNGDALFAEDVFSPLGTQLRFTGIGEIHAGGGDDLVDMTGRSCLIEDETIRIYGGDGDDIIWGGADSNILFGDSGNDRLVGASGNDIITGGGGNDSMHGGGGSDIFCFGSDWGTDSVEQFRNGQVTLWFEEGSLACWNPLTLTYTDGNNRVTVTGCAAVTLKFGASETLPEGAFAAAVANRIFK